MDNKTLVNDASYLLSQTDARRFLRIERLGSTTWRKTIASGDSTCQIRSARKPQDAPVRAHSRARAPLLHSSIRDNRDYVNSDYPLITP